MTKTPNATRQPNYPNQIISDKPQPEAEHAALIAADLRRMEQEARELPGPSPTAGMNLGQRILHVGGRENAAGYIEFGSVAAVRALVGQVLRDLQAGPPAPAAVPVLYVSPEQLARHCDPEGAENAEAGRYLPARKTPAGKFMQPLYALAAAPAQAQDDRAAFKAYLQECDDCEIVPDVAGAFHAAWQKRAAPAQAVPSGMWTIWESLPGYLIDHCEGDIISEEGLQRALVAMLENPQYSMPPAAPAQEHATQLAGQGLANTGESHISRAAPVQAQEDARDALTLADQAWNFDSSAYESTRKANAEMLCKLQDCAQTIRSQHARIESQRAELVAEAARTLPAPDNVRAGEPYDNPAFEDLARTMGVWGTAQAALCAQFFLAGRGAVPAGVQPMFWVRLCSDGCYEGPLHNASIEEERKASGAWAPLYLGAAPTPAAQKRYRLLERGIDTIQADDEFLRDDAVTWRADPQGIFVGMPYMSNVLRPARRAIEAAP